MSVLQKKTPFFIDIFYSFIFKVQNYLIVKIIFYSKIIDLLLLPKNLFNKSTLYF